MVRMMVRKILFTVFALALVSMFSAPAAAQQQAPPAKITFGADAVATGTTSKFKLTPNPVSTMVEARKDYGAGSIRFTFEVRLDDRHSTEVAVRRDSLGEPNAWARSTSGETISLNNDESFSLVRQQFSTANTVIDLAHRVRLGKGFSAVAGMSYALFTQKEEYQVLTSIERGSLKSDYSFIGPVAGVSYSRSLGRRVTLTGETSLGALRQTGVETFRYIDPVSGPHSNSSDGAI